MSVGFPREEKNKWGEMTKQKDDARYSKISKESKIEDILQCNKDWVHKMNSVYPTLFSQQNAAGQEPHTLLIACADSRYNENCFNAIPGEIFTFKNIGNVVSLQDPSVHSMVEYGTNFLKIRRVILMGHTDCGAVKAVLDAANTGPFSAVVNTYLQDIKTMAKEQDPRREDEPEALFCKRMCIANVQRQLRNLKQMVSEVSHGDDHVEVFGMLYNVNSGLVESVS